MLPQIHWSLAVPLSLGLALCLLVGIGRLRWLRASEQQRRRLLNSGPALGRPSPPIASAGKDECASAAWEHELSALPPPVARYFRRVLAPGQELILSASLLQEGQFRLGTRERDWKRFVATQCFSTRPPGFLWDARIRMAPGVSIHVRDTLVDGQSRMHAQALGLFTVVDEAGHEELSIAALQRYLAEAVWFPTALLPSQGVSWTELPVTKPVGGDDSGRDASDEFALATLRHRGVEASLRFRFNAEGVITECFTPARFRAVEGRYEATPWLGVYRRYQQRQGLRIPMEGEVSWLLSDGRVPYWRGKVRDCEFHTQGSNPSPPAGG